MKTDRPEYKKTFRILHCVWAAIGLITCIVFAFAGGHPPGILFLPMIIPAWFIGHLLIWGTRRLAIRGLYSRAEETRESDRWPPSLLLALSLFGAITFLPPVLFGGVPIFMIIWPIFPICFVGLLLRKQWSRNLAFVVCCLPAAYFSFNIIDYHVFNFFSTGQNHSWRVSEIIIGASYFSFAFLGFHIQRSQSVRAFLSAQESV